MYSELRDELDVIASVELGDVLQDWGDWNADQRLRLRDYLTEELSPGGMLSVEKGRESGMAMGQIRKEARALLGQLNLIL